MELKSAVLKANALECVLDNDWEIPRETAANIVKFVQKTLHEYQVCTHVPWSVLNTLFFPGEAIHAHHRRTHRDGRGEGALPEWIQMSMPRPSCGMPSTRIMNYLCHVPQGIGKGLELDGIRGPLERLRAVINHVRSSSVLTEQLSKEVCCRTTNT